MRSKDKVYIYMNEELLFFENQELSSILENLKEEAEIEEKNSSFSYSALSLFFI